MPKEGHTQLLQVPCCGACELHCHRGVQLQNAGVPGMLQMHPTYKEPQKSEAETCSHYCKAHQCFLSNPVALDGSQTEKNTCNIES